MPNCRWRWTAQWGGGYETACGWWETKLAAICSHCHRPIQILPRRPDAD